MAISLKTLNEISGVREAYTKGDTAFNLLTLNQYTNMDSLINSTMNKLEQKIKEYEDLEAEFKEAFNCSSLDAFKQRVEAYYYKQHNLNTFTGANLDIIVEDFKTLLKDEDIERQRRFDLLFEGFIRSYNLSKEWSDALNGKEVAQSVTQEIIREFIHMINGLQTSGGNLQFTAQTKRFSSNSRDLSSALVLVANRGTTAFKKYLNNAYEQALKGAFKYTDTKGKQRTLQINTTQQVSKFQASTTFAIKWGNIIRSPGGTGLLTKTEIEERLKNGTLTTQKIGQMNSKIIQLICDELQVGGFYKQYVIKKLSSMLRVDNYMFMTGNSYTNLEGILGEINAVIAIGDLLGPKYLDAAMHWIGSQTGAAGKQPSIDIVIENLVGSKHKLDFGFQVKNTVNELGVDLKHYVKFADKDVSEILSGAGIQSEDIEMVYVSDTYNVPYKKKGNLFRQVGHSTRWDKGAPETFEEFIGLEDNIDELVAKINMYLTRFASDLIYMAMPDFPNALATLDSALTRSARGNFCYIVGGSAFFANEMLNDLYEQLDALRKIKSEEERAAVKLSLQFETYFDKGGKATRYNIVSYKNARAKDDSVKPMEGLKIKMKSSWGFHK